MYAWTDSTIVLAWIQGNPRRFKIYVANRVAQIVDLIPAQHWGHVISKENPADCASRGIYPSDLLLHDLWWQGPVWMKLPPSNWPKTDSVVDDTQGGNAELNTTLCTMAVIKEPLIPVDRVSSFDSYKRVTAWVMRFIHNCRARIQKDRLSCR